MHCVGEVCMRTERVTCEKFIQVVAVAATVAVAVAVVVVAAEVEAVMEVVVAVAEAVAEVVAVSLGRGSSSSVASGGKSSHMAESR